MQIVSYGEKLENISKYCLLKILPNMQSINSFPCA